MNSHTHYLSALLVLTAVSFPTSLIGIFIKLNLGRINNILPNALSYALFVIMVFFTGYIGIINYSANIYFIIIAFVFSFICIGLELFEGIIIHFIKYRVWIKNIEVHKIIEKKNIFFDIIIIFIGALCEEIIFRQVFFNIAYNIFSINIFIVIILSAFIYAINHIYLGANAVFQKFIVGLIYSLLFVYSSFCIIIPVITHFSQNMILYLLSLKRVEKIN
ncbi:CPBP family intramembrane glutamic endopeptidase [uncultured Brachyspira sp.]|uniref:CPBP family intramembrane glutamic endopeptidase n=1 Tax=uncultured Brachyspira sp. TaxID=221953 RepID=UPI0026138E4D|nr:CPBP family intramembrane glutamic endopeptidase [uncultured Brachyspira sp.]